MGATRSKTWCPSVWSAMAGDSECIQLSQLSHCSSIEGQVSYASGEMLAIRKMEYYCMHMELYLKPDLQYDSLCERLPVARTCYLFYRSCLYCNTQKQLESSGRRASCSDNRQLLRQRTAAQNMIKFYFSSKASICHWTAANYS